MNQKTKKPLIKSLAILFSAASLLTASAPQTFAGNIISSCFRSHLTNEEQDELNRQLVEVAHHKTCNKLMVKKLLLQGADPNINTDNTGRIPLLILAIANQNRKLVKLLIRHRANVRVTYRGNQTVFHALFNGNRKPDIEICKLLVKHNREAINAVNSQGRSPLSYVNRFENPDLFNYLRENGARKIIYGREVDIDQPAI